MTTELATADVLLTTGSLAVVRALRADDRPALHDLHQQVSDDALRFRFFSVARATAHEYVDHVVGSPDRLALVAEAGGRVVALATAEPLDARTAEVAFLVADDHRGQGLGTLLLEHLAALARDRGIAQFRAEVLADNHRMLQVFRDACFATDRQVEDGVVVLRMSTAVTAAAQEAADDREFTSESRSLRALFRPRAVAVYGVRRDGTGIGAAVLTAIREGGYQGQLTVAHPSATEVAGVPAYRSLTTAAARVDLAVVAVPADAAVAALEDAGAAGASVAVVVSSGFGEMGPSGAELQDRLAATCRRLGIRLVGPNCLGAVSNAAGVRLNATFGRTVPPPGGLAVGSQSGGVGIALMDLVARAGVGLHSFVSLGNKADVSGNDLIAAWSEDGTVKCGALYLESFGNARKFARFALRFSQRKPLLAVVGGRSAGGRRAGASHTAAAASPALGVHALFAQAGVISCRDAEELAETALLLTREPLPAGRRVAVISNAGGLGVLAADSAEDEGLQVAEFSPVLQERLRELVHQTTGTANPVDAGAGAEDGRLAAITETVLASGEVDAVLVTVVATGTTNLTATLDSLAEVQRRRPEVPLLVVAQASPEALEGRDITLFRSAAAALGALGRVSRYVEWRRSKPGPVEASDPVAVREARALARRLRETGGASGWMPPREAGELLGRYGIAVVGKFVTGNERAVAAASQLGYPVAVKLAAADVIHKTEHQLVRTALRDDDEVRAAVEDLEAFYGLPCPLLVQPMEAGVELALGVVRDPVMGPLIMVAAGGTATDVLADRAFLLPPFAADEALRVLRALRTWPLLDGFRGAQPTDTPGVAILVAALGRLAVDVPEVLELDLNPVMVSPRGAVVVDAKLRLGEPPTVSLDLPRQLRPSH